jgi:capsular exopolysaccharide synthesis family protein
LVGRVVCVEEGRTCELNDGVYDQTDPSESLNESPGAIVPRAYDGALSVPSMSAPQVQGPHEGADALRDTLAQLYRARWTVAAVFFAIMLVGLPAIWMGVKPKYQAVAVVRVAPEDLTILHPVDGPGLGQYYPLFVETQKATITNAAVLQNALERAEVQATPWYDEAPRSLKTLLGSSPPNHLERLKSVIEVEQQGMTDLLDIMVTTSWPDDAHVLANAVLEEYLTYTEEKSNELESLRFRTLREEHRDVVAQIEGLVEQRGELSKKLGTDDPDLVRAILAEDLSKLEMERKLLNRRYEQVRWDLNGRGPGTDGAVVDDSGAESAGDELPAESRYALDGEWRRRFTDVRDAKQELDEAGQTFGESHPRMQLLRSRLESKQRRLAEREQELGPNFQPATAVRTEGPQELGVERSDWFLDRTSLLFSLMRSKRELDILDEDIAKLKAEQEEKGELAKQMAQIGDQLRRKQEMENTLDRRIQALMTEKKAPGRISIAAPALPVSEAYKDKRLMLSVMTVFGALFCGVAAAHLRSNFDPKVVVADDVQRSARAPFLGQLPHSPNAGTLLHDPNLLVQECMRMVRTALLERLAGSRRRAIMITSATSSAGKTTVAIELAKSLAHLGKRTLLVEADLRRPTLAKRLGLENECGLCALLSGEAEERAAVTSTGFPNLDVIFAGRRSPVLNPELLANGVFGACLARWKKNYDFVLLDCPPVLPVADSRILARQVDGVIMVSRSSHCRRTDVIQACADLTAAGGPLLGSVLVGVQPGLGYGYRYEYQYEPSA